jgi:hypothetical protein
MMAYSSGKCHCGAVSIAIDMRPFLTYNCHCSHCRDFASRYRPEPVPFHGGGAVWKWNVDIKTTTDDVMEYERSYALGGLFAMSRGRCRICHQPIWEKGERAILPLAMVMTHPLLPELHPDTDIFYNSGLQQGPTPGSTTILRSDWGSLLYELFVIVFVAIPLLPYSIFQRLTRQQQQREHNNNSNKGAGNKETKLS